MTITTAIQQDIHSLVHVTSMNGVFFAGDDNANRIEVEVTDGGAPAVLSGNVFGYAVRSDGVTVPMNGTLSENIVSIVLPASAYVAIGLLSIVIKVGTTTVCACATHVYRSETEDVVDPGEVVPSMAELLEQIAVMEDLIEEGQALIDELSGYGVVGTLITGNQYRLSLEGGA